MKLATFSIIIVVLIILLVIIKLITNEGYEDTINVNTTVHDNFDKKYKKRFNRLGTALVAMNNMGVIGEKTKGVFGNLVHTMDESGRPVQEMDDPYPLEKGKNDLILTIDKCEKVTTTDCNIFDNPEFSKQCGLCLEIGTNSANKKAVGGLVISEKDKNYARDSTRGLAIPDYEPTIGSCPAKRFVTTKDECIRVTNQMNCAKNNTFNSPDGCSLCYADGSYSVVDPRGQPDLIQGTGTIYLIGSGRLTFTESGYGNSTLIKLTNTPRIIPLAGPEYNTIQMNLQPEPEAKPFDNFYTYKVGDLVIHNNNVYEMIEYIGAAGYAPDGAGKASFSKVSSFETYIPEPPPFVGGYITGDTAGGKFTMDLFRIVIKDNITGRRPRVQKMVKLNDEDISMMTPGFNSKKMNLIVRSPFTFIDQYSQEATNCTGSPFVTRPESAKQLGSDPCYTRDSEPGKYSVECLENLFLNNSCSDKGSGYPTTPTKSGELLFDKKGNARSLADISDFIYEKAVIAATGLDPTGKSLSFRDWSENSVFCTGQAITSPCDIAARDTGPLTSDCLAYLWDNQGENKKTGATYGLMSFARSMFDNGKKNRFCTRSGILSPRNLDNKDNESAMKYWKKMGGVDAVKNAMSQLHLDANSSLIPEDKKYNTIVQCYGVVPNPRATLVSKYASDTTIEVLPKPVVICPPSGIKYTKLGEFKLGFIDTQPCWNINKPEFSSDGWIFISNRNDWRKITDGQRNETWAHIQLTAKDMNGNNVINAVKPISNSLNIPERIGQQPPPYINYLIKHKTKNSSVILNKCGYIIDIQCRQGAIVGMYMGNNWSTQYKETQGSYVVDMISDMVGVPLMGPDDVYELYFAVTTDTCIPDPETPVRPTPPPARYGVGWNL
jgi:hypothetical protein